MSVHFKEAFKLLLEGKKIKRKEWFGYWVLSAEKDTIYIHCDGGSILDIKEGDILYSIRNMVCEDWEIATVENSEVLEIEETNNKIKSGGNDND